jgi:hypothetical protein
MAIFGDLRGGKRPKPGLLETASAMHKVALAERLFARAKKAVNKAKDRRSMAVYSFLVPSDDLLADPEDIRVAFQWWWKLDPRFTGLIQTSEFLKEILVCRDQSTDYFKARRMELGALSLARLLSSTVGITDFVAVVWSDYHGKAREEICNIIAYHLFVSKTVEPLPCLDDKSRIEYLSIFEDMDLDNSGDLELDELKVTGLFSEDDFREIKERYDTDGDGAVDMVEFLELVTPEGYRGHEYCASCNTKPVGEQPSDRLCLYEGLTRMRSPFRGWLSERTVTELSKNKMLKALKISRFDLPVPLSWKALIPPGMEFKTAQREMKQTNSLPQEDSESSSEAPSDSGSDD